MFLLITHKFKKNLWPLVFVMVFFGLNISLVDAANITDDTQVEFDAGTYSYTQYDSGNSWVEGTNTTPNPLWELPDNASTTGWQNMTGNVGLWHMNESSGTISDTSGQDSDGTAYGGVTYSATGKLKTALNFDGSNDYISAGTIPKYASSTIAVWVKSEKTQNTYAGVVFAGDGNNGWGLAISSGYVFSRTTNGSARDNWYADAYNETNYPDGWHLLILTDDGTTRKYYRDGTFISEHTSIFINSGTDQALSIGRWGTYSATSAHFKGDIDEVAIFNRALSATEIANIYKNQAPLYTGTFTSDIKDVGDSTYNSIAWVPERPMEKELPDNAVSETAYNSGNANMTGNVLLMHMNESSGTIEDTSGQDNDGTQNGEVAYSSTGKFNTALSFDGVDDYVSVTDNASFDWTTAGVSVEAWINGTNPSSPKGIISKSNAGAQPYEFNLSIETDGRIRFWVSNTGSDVGPFAYSTAPIIRNKWNHIVGTYDGTNITVYLNGVAGSSVVKSGVIHNGSGDLNIGRWPSGS